MINKNLLSSSRKRTGGSERNAFSRIRRLKLKKPDIKFIWRNYKRHLLLVLALLAIVVGRGFFGNKKSEGRETLKTEVQGAKASQELNRDFSFPLKNGDGEEISRIKFIIEKAELKDEIVIKGQRATAISGRVFLILTLKVTNEHSQPIEIDTRDYVRLSVGGNEEEWLAPDIHNDPVEVQAISTKYTRVGFPINETDSKLLLRIGEINGEKEMVTLDLD